jgi:hypothetical protein
MILQKPTHREPNVSRHGDFRICVVGYEFDARQMKIHALRWQFFVARLFEALLRVGLNGASFDYGAFHSAQESVRHGFQSWIGNGKRLHLHAPRTERAPDQCQRRPRDSWRAQRGEDAKKESKYQCDEYEARARLEPLCDRDARSEEARRMEQRDIAKPPAYRGWGRRVKAAPEFWKSGLHDALELKKALWASSLLHFFDWR